MSIRMRTGALALCLPLFAAGCGSSGDNKAADSTASSAAGTASTTPSSGTDALDDKNAWALSYTGGKAGAATGASFKVGYVNADAILPGSTIGVKAAVEYINAELGGVGGRPIELVSCAPATPEQAGQCGSKLANDSSISTVLVGTMDKGNKELYDAIGGKKAILVSTPLSSEDFVTPHAVSFSSGSPGVLIGLAKAAIGELKAKTVSVIIPDQPSGRAAVQGLLKPIFDAAGVTMKAVFINPQGTTPEMTTALQASGAAKSDALLATFGPGLCIALYDATKSLGITPKVLTTDQCSDTTVQAHLKSVGDTSIIPSWYYGNFGYNFRLPDVESGMATYKLKAGQYAKPLGSAPVELAGGFAGPGFATAMSITKIINQVGVDKATYATVDAALRGFTGPSMLQVGPLKCGVPPFVAVCGHQMGVDTFADGKWVSVRDGLNGKPIDLLAKS